MARLPRSSRIRATVFVATVVVVVLAASVGPGVLRGDAGAEARAYEVDELVPERAPADGELAIEHRNESGVVLVDQAHGNRLTPDELEPLFSAVTAAGYEVRRLGPNDDLDRGLAGADAFVVADPGTAYTEAEARRVEAFAERGGRLLLIGEPTQGEQTGIAVVARTNRLGSLASRFGFEFGEAYLYNMATNDGNFQNIFAAPNGRSRVTKGVSRVALYTATTVQAREGRTVLVASDGSRSSRTDATGPYPVAAVNGNALAIGDGTFLRRGNFNVVDNERLVRNVVRFLVSGTKERTLWTYPAVVGPEPTVHYTGPALLRAAQTLGADLRRAGKRPTLALRRQGVGPDRTDVLVTTFDFLARRGELETGITANDRRVRVAGYESNATGVIVVRAPADGYDLVVAADTPSRARRGATLLVDGELDRHRLTERTAVIRTDAAVRLVPVGNATAP
ncbi:MAG: hypothetical protein ABEJ92_01775 [Halobacteriales archaeon]